MYEDIVLNKYQTPISELGLDKQPQEVQDQFWDFFNNVPFIRSMVSPNKPRARDLPRDSEGKIIVDITQPHILEDIDYFRPSAIHYQKYGRFTDLRPNANPNSEFGKWIREERRRCLYGYIRPYDGEWITGDHYFFLNYCPISLLKKSSNGGRKAMRVIDFPFSWEGNYYRFHYLNQAREHGLMAAELARRGCGKSFCAAAMLAKRFILGESFEVNKRVVSYITATDKAKLTGGDQTLDKFQFYIDFIAENMQWPSRRLYNSLADMNWQMGYKDLNTGTNKGTLNSVVGKSSQNDASKLRGTRGVLYLFEEAGTFDNLLTLWSNLLPSVSDGESVFGLMYLFGTSGDQQSDFAAMQEIMYNPVGYKTYGLKNVYDKEGQGRPTFTYFFPAYINRSGCYDEQGNSDVTKALLEILVNRYNVKYNSTDINTITKCIAEIPITPQEAILRTRGNIFPVADLTQRLAEIDNDPHTFDDVYVGDLTQEKDGTVSFKLTGDQPIRDFPLKDNKVSGALEIFKMPEKDAQGKVFPQRYIIGHDPVDNDEADTMSLSSTFVLDLWTDTIVAEYTGRHQFADDNFEMLRKLGLFYNAKILYEAHPYDQIVRLPTGETKFWGDIEIGDKLFAPNGKTVRVVNVPIDGEDDIYRVTLSDGRSVEASKNHIWNVIKYGRKRPYNTTTVDILNNGLYTNSGQHKFFIQNGGAVNYEHKDVPIDPYTLGLLISEGALTKFPKNKKHNKKRRNVQISSAQQDAEFYKTIIPYEIKHIGNNGYSWHIYIDDIDKKLESLGLLHKNSQTKFIPDVYLYNDKNTRMELLRGLMDGDGCATKKGSNIYITISKKLAEDLILLCRSLGMYARYHKCVEERDYLFSNSGNTYRCKKTYRIAVTTNERIFNLPRKVEKQYINHPGIKGSKAGAFLYKIAIDKIEYVGRKRCKCVTVDSDDGLYMVGDYVVTHNCNIKGVYSYFSRMNCLYLLADTPEYLKDKDIIKNIGVGNNSKGVKATKPVNDYANRLIRDWLLKPVTIQSGEDGEETTVFNLTRIRNRALIKELMLYNPDINVDRIRALGLLMLYREQFMVMYNGDPSSSKNVVESDYLGNDDYFTRNYDNRLRKHSDNVTDS